VLNISSEGVRRPVPYLSVYLATKGAVEMLSFALKVELRPDGIRVTLLRSGGSTGGFVDGWDPDDARRAFERWNEMGFLDFVGVPMPPEVIAESVVHAATRPPGASVDFLEVRSATPFPRNPSNS
jgi:NADP-dependent 3-hydroxy acid dehydrogenase YdfG